MFIGKKTCGSFFVDETNNNKNNGRVIITLYYYTSPTIRTAINDHHIQTHITLISKELVPLDCHTTYIILYKFHHLLYRYYQGRTGYFWSRVQN